jgi:glycosyltransferase involved in cell wall biosynthesis
MGMPVEVGGRESVVSASTESDVLLVSDPGVDSEQVGQWILEAKPAVTVFVAHGDGEYTRDRLSGIGPAVDHIVAVSRHVQREVCQGWPVSMILNGVDPRRLVKTQPREISRQALGFGDRDFVVGFVGRFSEEKNPQLVIDAVAQLPPRYKALLIGHGYMRSNLVEQCMASTPGRFVILEGDGELGDLYASMDTLVMPSRLEGYGLVAMEAMMCGVPVIATPYGMIADLVSDHVNALVVPPTASEIARAAMELGEHPSLRRSVIAGGKRLANLTGYASQMAREYERLLCDLWLAAQERPNANR